MNYFVELLSDSILIRLRLLSETGLAVGQVEETVMRGESACGLTYEQLRERGPGEFFFTVEPPVPLMP